MTTKYLPIDLSHDDVDRLLRWGSQCSQDDTPDEGLYQRLKRLKQQHVNAEKAVPSAKLKDHPLGEQFERGASESGVAATMPTSALHHPGNETEGPTAPPVHVENEAEDAEVIDEG